MVRHGVALSKARRGVEGIAGGEGGDRVTQARAGINERGARLERGIAKTTG